DRAAPLGGGALVRVVLVAKPEDADQILVQHAGGNIQQDEDALAAQGEPGDVAAFGGRASAHPLAQGRALDAPGFEAPVALIERANVRLELLDVLAAGKRLGVVARELPRPAS